MSYKKYIQYMNDLGLTDKTSYDYKNKNANILNETERMLDRSVMMFDWHNLPDTIPKEELELMLQTQGYAIIAKNNNDLYAFYGSLGGELDEYYRPTKAIVSNPYLNLNREFTIGTDCVLIKNDLMCQGLLPMYSKYSTFEIETDISLILALVNLRVQAYISASDDKAIQSAKEFIDNLYNGELSVIADDKMLQSLNINVVNKYQDLSNIKEVQQYIRGQLFNEIGLATNYNLKKERITQAEVELNTDNLYPFIDNMYERRKEGIEKVKDLFNEEWEVEFNSSWDYRIMNGEPITTKGVEDVSTNDSIGGNSGSVIDSSELSVTSNDMGSEEQSNKTRTEVQDNTNDSDTISNNDDSSINDDTNTSDTDLLQSDNNNVNLSDDILMEVEKGIVDLADKVIEERDDNND